MSIFHFKAVFNGKIKNGKFEYIFYPDFIMAKDVKGLFVIDSKNFEFEIIEEAGATEKIFWHENGERLPLHILMMHRKILRIRKKNGSRLINGTNWASPQMDDGSEITNFIRIYCRMRSVSSIFYLQFAEIFGNGFVKPGFSYTRIFII